MAESNNDSRNNNSGSPQKNQGTQNQNRNKEGNPSERNIMAEDSDSDEGTEMPGRETRTPTAGNDSQNGSTQSKQKNYGSEQGRNSTTEQNRSQSPDKTQNQGE